jgi:hypothetical protein
LVRELLAGREPTLEILYVAGLADVATTARPTADVVDLLTTRIRRAGPIREQEAA